MLSCSTESFNREVLGLWLSDGYASVSAQEQSVVVDIVMDGVLESALRARIIIPNIVLVNRYQAVVSVEKNAHVRCKVVVGEAGHSHMSEVEKGFKVDLRRCTKWLLRKWLVFACKAVHKLAAIAW